MSLDPALLSAGPRGRRLLLEFAVRSEALASGDVTTELPLWKALFDHVLASPSRRPVAGWGEDFVPRPCSPDDLARRLSSAPLVRARPTLLLDALRRSAAASPYQPGGTCPVDPVDSLLANWRTDPALARVARQVCSTGKVGWWARPLRRDEQILVEAGHGVGRQGPAKPPAPAKALARQSRETSPGQWSSAPAPELPLSSRRWPRRGPVAALVAGDPVANAPVRRLAVRRSTRVLDVTGADDWLDLCRRWPREVTATHGPAWSATIGADADLVVPDWRRVARHHDVVHLPVAAWLALADRPLEVGPGAATMVAGWLPGAAVWLCAPG